MQPCAEVLMAAEKIRLSWREKMIFMNYFLQVWRKKLKVCYNQLNVAKRIANIRLNYTLYL